MLHQIQVYYQEYFKYYLELIHSPSCLKQEYLPTVFYKAWVRSSSHTPSIQSPGSLRTSHHYTVKSYAPSFKYDFYTLLGKV